MSGSEEAGGGHLILETLIAIIILLFYTISAPLFEKYHFHYMHESGMCMIIGVLITFLSGFLSSNSDFSNNLKFNDEIFFTFILPPIIFAAGYNLNRRSFFKYFMYIFVFGVIGTIITFSVVAPLTYLANKYDMFYFTFYDKDSFKENHLLHQHPEKIQNISLPLVPEPNEHNSHLLLNNYILTSNQETHENNSTILTDEISNGITDSLIKNQTNITVISAKNPKEDKTEISKEDSKKEILIKEKYYKDSIIKFSVKDILLFSSVISATDTVAALTFIKEDKDPKLFAILFGEGVLNDAVCIVLYRIIKEFTDSNEEFSSKTPFVMMNKFLNLFFFSFLVGTIVGILSSLFLKKFKYINLNRVQECSIIIFFAFISYTLAEELGLSPIISLLFTGMFMSHYTFYNLSFQAREESSIVSKMMSNIAEAFVFTYLGLTVLFYMTHALSISFIFWELIIVILGRIIGIFGLSFIVVKIFKVKNFRLKLSEKGIMSCAGSIRGAIAFGLAISIDSKNRQIKEVLISSTLILVFFTTIFFGALMPFAIKFFKSFDKEEGILEKSHEKEEQHHNEEEGKLIDFSHPNFNKNEIVGHKEKDINKLKARLSYWLGTYWVDFDHVYMKPRLVHNWPNVKEENDELSDKILNLAEGYKQELKERNEKIKDDANLNSNDLELKDLHDDNLGRINLSSSKVLNFKESNNSNFGLNKDKWNMKVSFLKDKKWEDENNNKNEKNTIDEFNIMSPKSAKSGVSNKSNHDIKNKNIENLKYNIKDEDNLEDMFKNMNIKK